MKDGMTPRERWLAALRLLPVDRLPFWPKLGGSWLRRQGAVAGLADLEAAHGWIGSDRHDGVGNGLVEKRTRTGYEKIRENGLMIDRYTAAGRTMIRESRYDADSETWHPVRMPVRMREDIRAMTAWYEDTVVEIDEQALEVARARVRAVGEQACTMSSAGESSLMFFIEYLAGPAETHLLLADHPAECAALFAAMDRVLARRWELALEKCPADTLYLIENTSTTLISPAQYRRYCKPFLAQLARNAVAAGKIMILHMCGHLKALLPDLADLGVSGFEAFSSPTVGNTTLADGRAACRDVCLIGGTNATLWLQPADGILAELERHLGQLPHHRGLVVTSAGVMPPAATAETIRAVCRRVQEFPARM